MIYGIGTDLCEIRRMEKSLARPRFLARVFGPEEQALLEQLPPARRAASAAANFAAKEAFLKAAGMGLGGLPLADIQCLRQQSAAPVLVCTGAAAEWLREHWLRALVSLTHEGGLAAAFVVLEENSPVL